VNEHVKSVAKTKDNPKPLLFLLKLVRQMPKIPTSEPLIAHDMNNIRDEATTSS
jgi:hypothetical protein